MSVEQASEPTPAKSRDLREADFGVRRRESLKRMRALANQALLDGDPHKLTARWADDLRVAANELRAMRRMLHPADDGALGLTSRLVEYACVIAEVVETEPELVQRGD
jgi:hypothetical protein